MKNFKRFAVLPLIFILIFAAAGCKKKAEYGFYTNMPQDGYTISDKSFRLRGQIGGYVSEDRVFEERDTSNYTSKGLSNYEMGTYYDITVSADFTAEGAEEKFSAFKAKAVSTLADIGNALSTTATGSDIYNFNAAAAGEKVAVSEITYEVLTEAKRIYGLTDGCYNPALYYNVLAYGFGSDYNIPQSAAELPADEVIAKYTALAAHFAEIFLSEENGEYFVTKPAATVEVDGQTLSLKLDLGGIGKGYAVDEIDKLFDEYGYKFGSFNFGSSSVLIKSNYKTGNYYLQLTNPRSFKRDTFLTTPIRDEKLSTSGDNEQFYNIDGTRYCHIIDPATGKPVQTGIMSVTVIGGGAAEADALTTAIMCMGKERAVEFIGQKLSDRRVVFTCE